MLPITKPCFPTQTNISNFVVKFFNSNSVPQKQHILLRSHPVQRGGKTTKHTHTYIAILVFHIYHLFSAPQKHILSFSLILISPQNYLFRPFQTNTHIHISFVCGFWRRGCKKHTQTLFPVWLGGGCTKTPKTYLIYLFLSFP